VVTVRKIRAGFFTATTTSSTGKTVEIGLGFDPSQIPTRHSIKQALDLNPEFVGKPTKFPHAMS